MTREEIKRLADDYSELSGELGFASGRRRAEVLRPMVAEARAALHAAIDAEHTRAEQLAECEQVAIKDANFWKDRAERAEAALRELCEAADALKNADDLSPRTQNPPWKALQARYDSAWAAARAIVRAAASIGGA